MGTEHYLVNDERKIALYCGKLPLSAKDPARVTVSDLVGSMNVASHAFLFALMLRWVDHAGQPVRLLLDTEIDGDYPWAEAPEGWEVYTLFEPREGWEERSYTLQPDDAEIAVYVQMARPRVLELRVEELECALAARDATFAELYERARGITDRLLTLAKQTTTPVNPADPSGRWGTYRAAMMRVSRACELDQGGDRLTATLLLQTLVHGEESPRGTILAQILRRRLDDLLGLS